MVVDYRAYTFRPGTVPVFMELFETVGLPIQERILGKHVFLGIYRTEIGNVNEVIHLWGYADAAERGAKRAQLYDDPEFMAYVVRARELIVSQDVRLLVASPVNPGINRA
ncbi:MAG: NIPSNAP family protein [Hyphomicrobiales bacterium]